MILSLAGSHVPVAAKQSDTNSVQFGFEPFNL